MEHTYTILAAAAIAIAGVAAWGPLPGPAGAQSEASQTHHVHIENFDMDPDPLVISPGDTVEWHNHDDPSHTATENGHAWDTGTLQTGDTAQITFDEPASYEYFCQVHPGSMTGFELIVSDPPSVAIDAPADGATVVDTVTIEGTALDPEGALDRVEVRIDGGAWQPADGLGDWSFEWDTTRVSDGLHTVEARSVDDAGLTALASVTLDVFNADPNLALTELEVDEGLTESTVTATVANEGAAEAGPSTLELRYETSNNADLIAEHQLDALDPGAVETVTVSWDTREKVGEFTVIAQADVDGEVDEKREDDNEARTTACFPPVEGATCTVPGTDLGPYTP